jgi:myxalamid-type nonribosomal peptide synthetase MxaA
LSVFNASITDPPRIVDETSPIDNEKHWASAGYSTSKWVGEKIFTTARERGIHCNIFRLGLVFADTQKGRYDEMQREYRIFKSCLLSGCGIKHYRYAMPPTPVDYVARAVVFLANRYSNGQGTFHISSSNSMAEGVFERCNEIAGTSLALKSWREWIAEIKRLHHEGKSLPAVPLVEFAFSMGEESFSEHQRRIGSGQTRFDCARTHRELERAGIAAPVLDDQLLMAHLESMLSRDAELRDYIAVKRCEVANERYA